MKSKKFGAGAFCFTRTRGLQPRDPSDLQALATQHGFEDLVPSYAGDRAAVGRAIQITSSGLWREQFLLRPLRRTSSEVTYAIVKERHFDKERLDHFQEALVRWTAEPDPSVIHGDHAIAHRVNDNYQNLRGKIVSEDWSAAIAAHLDKLDAAPVRSDGRVYWVPPQRVDEVRRLGDFLQAVGIDLILAEMEPETRTVVQEVVKDSLVDQIERLEAEVAGFDGRQKPSVYERRLKEYSRLRARAILYRDALGVGVDRTETVLDELEAKVTEMLDIRTNSVVHRDGSVDGALAGGPLEPDIDGDACEASSPPATGLRFGGAEFQPAASSDPDVLVFISGDEMVIAAVKALESMGVAGKWQKAGGAEVKIGNSGPVGADVSIQIRVPNEQSLETAASSLANLGIEVC